MLSATLRLLRSGWKGIGRSGPGPSRPPPGGEPATTAAGPAGAAVPAPAELPLRALIAADLRDLDQGPLAPGRRPLILVPSEAAAAPSGEVSPAP